MMSLSTIKLDLEKKSYGYAKIYASLIKDEFQRKRAYASLVALYAFLNLIERTPFNIQKAMTLFRNPLLNEKFELSDIYVNNWHLDVRIVVGGNAFLVPKSHLDNGLLPDFYIVVRVDKTLENAELIGIADTTVMKSEPFDYHYNTVSFSNLISYDDFLLKIQRDKKVKFEEEDHEFFRKSYLSITDGSADKDTINRVLKHVFECNECRTEFCCFTGFEMVSSNTSKYPELMHDETLNIVGAQKVDDEKYKGKEETIYIGKDEIKDNKNNNTVKSSETAAKVPFEKNTEATPEQTIETASEIHDVADDTVNDLSVLDEFGIEEDETQISDNKEFPVSDVDLVPDMQPDEVSSETQGETVSDILDELFNVEEDYLAHKEAEEKELEKSELEFNNVSDDLSVLNEPVDLFGDERHSELETITDANDSEIETISDNPIGYDKDELIDFSGESEESRIEPIEGEDFISNIEDDNDKENVNENGNMQKVIIDYDETGEPVYSYVTPVENSDDESVQSEKIDEIQTINENSENNKNTDIVEDIPQDTEETISEITEETSEDTVEEAKSEELQITEETDEGEQSGSDDYSQAYIMYDNMVNGGDDTQEEKEEDNTNLNDNDDSDDSSSIDDDNSGSEIEEADDETSEDDSESEDADDDNSEEEDGDDDDEEEYDEDEEEYEDDEEGTQKRGSAKKAVVLICSILLLLGLIGGGIMLFVKNLNSKNEIVQGSTENNLEIPQELPQNTDIIEIPSDDNGNQGQNMNNAQDENSGNSTQAEEINIPQLTENDLIVENNPPVSDPNKAITNAFANGGAAPVSVNGINWNCTAALFTDKTFKNYLQNLDNLLKQNLKNNILNVTEIPQNRNVVVKLSINNDGNLEKVMISESSGSAQIDDIVLQSINEMFMGEKSPILENNALKQDRYYLKVVIKL